MKSIIRNHICLGLLAFPAFAQEAPVTSPAFEKAVAVEELEHDLRGAAELYEHLAAATNTSKELRARANLRLGLAYRKLGDEQKALAALKLAASGKGSVSKQAALAIGQGVGDPAENQELQFQAAAALKRAETAFRESANLQYSEQHGIYLGGWSAAGEDLVWLGASAVPTIRMGYEMTPTTVSQDTFVYVGPDGKPVPKDSIPNSSSKAADSRNFRNEILKPAYRAYLASILWEIGSPEAREFLSELGTSSDSSRSMAAARGLLECGQLNPGMIELYLELVSNPKVPIQVVRTANSAAARTNPRRGPILTQLSAEQFLSLVNAVPQAVAVDLWRKLDGLGYKILDLENPSLNLAETIRSMLDSAHPGLNQIGFKVLGRYGLYSPDLRILTLDFLDRVPDGFKLTSFRSRRGAVPPVIEPSLRERELAHFTEAIVRVGHKPGKQSGQTIQAKVVESLGRIYFEQVGPMVLPVIMKMAENNYLDFDRVSKWLRQDGQSVQASDVTKLMVSSAVFDHSAHWFSLQELDGQHVPGLKAAMERLRAQGVKDRQQDPDGSMYSGTSWSLWLRFLEVLSHVDSPNARSYMVELAESEYQAVVSYVLSRSRDDGAQGFEPLLRKLLHSQARHSNPKTVPHSRTQVLVRLVELGDMETMMNPAAWSGFELVAMDRVKTQLSGVDASLRSPLSLISHVIRTKGGREGVHGYTASQMATLWTHHLANPELLPNSNAFEFVGTALRLGSSTSPMVFDGITVPATEAWIRRLEAKDFPTSKAELYGLQSLQSYCMDSDVQAKFAGEKWVELLALSFDSGNADVAEGAIRSIVDKHNLRWEPRVRSWLFDPKVGATALWSLDDLGAKLTDAEVQAIAASDNKDLRKSCLNRLNVMAPDVPVEHVRPFLEDSDSDVRYAACVALAEKLDSGAVPGLLSLLGDNEEKVRLAAKSALEQIRFYHDEKARWERFFQGQEVSTVGAAQRLLQQAAPDQPLAQRVLAIRALGTLGTPEVLPFLIDWVAQGPPEVASAAKSAIERIHLAGGATVDVK